MQKFYTCIAILLTFCSAACSWNNFDKEPYLQNVGKDQITIMWESTYTTKSRVDYGITKDCNLFVEEPKEKFLHEVTLRPLRANTRYYYEINCGFDTETGSFKTAPNHNIPFKFVVYGDNRAQPEIHEKIARGILQANPDLILHTGDLVKDGTKTSQWKTLFFEPLQDLIDHVPIFTCLGNHERNAKNYFNFFSLPNNESWYSFNYSNCHFTVLDTCKPYGKKSKQYKWLINDLRNAHTKWKFVVMHHPPYSSGLQHGSSLKVRQRLTPLFRRQGVDVVFCGHSHIYERSHPIGSAFGSQHDPVTYIVTGGGGAKLYDTTPNLWTVLTKSTYNFCVVEMDGDRLKFKALDVDGKVLDKFSIAKEKGKYQQYVRKAIPCEQIEFERKFPDKISSPVVLLKKGRELVKGAVEIQNPFPARIDVKIMWHHLNDWNLRPKQISTRIGGKKTARIPFLFRSPKLDKIWPPPRFSVVYDTGLASGRIAGKYLVVILPRALSCNKTNLPIDLDGRLKEPFWANALSANEFIQSDGSGLAKKQTTAKVVRGKDAIYFALVCYESDPESLSATVKERDGDLRNDESVIVSIVPHSTIDSSHSRDDQTVYQFGINCDGIECDSKGGRKKWSGKWNSSARINDDDWTVEMTIPYNVLELISPPKKGERWKINFFRSTKTPAEKSEWVTTLNSPLTPERFGVLVMN